MIDFRQGKIRYKVNNLGSLYIDESKVSKDEQPIIYIGGQMEHRGHLMERSGYTFDLNHNLYTGSWMYEYPITSESKRYINAQNFSENLLAALKEAKLSNVILLGHSHGGLIGAYASKSDLVDKVISVHTPLLGTPLSCVEYLEMYSKTFTKKQKLIFMMLKKILSSEYGFVIDNFRGIDLRNIDLNKLLVVGDYIDIDSELNSIILELYHLIKSLIDMRSDGIVPFEPKEFERLGVDYLHTKEYRNHFESNEPEYLDNVLKLVLKK